MKFDFFFFPAFKLQKISPFSHHASFFFSELVSKKHATVTFYEIKSLGPNGDCIHLYHVLSPCVFQSGCCRLCSSGPFDPFTQHYCLNCAGYFNSGIFDIDRRVSCKWHTEAGLPPCLLRVLLQYVCSSCYLYYTFTAVTRLSFTHSCSRVIEDQERSIIWVSYAFFSICASFLGRFVFRS